MSKTFDKYLSERYPEKEITVINERANKKAESYVAFKKSISFALRQYMEEKHIGFNEIKKELGTVTHKLVEF